MGGLEAAVFVTRGVMFMLQHGHTGTCSFSDLERGAVAAEHLDRRPFGQNRERWRRVRAEFLCRMNNISPDYGKHGFNSFDLFLGNCHVVVREHSQVGELAWSESALLSGFV